jgi:hypothetical protein
MLLFNQESTTMLISRPITEKQREANRRNALLSTGPQTPRGRAVSSQNARKYELLPYEKLSTARQVSAQYYGQYIPTNKNERRLVDTMIRSERLRRYYHDLESRVRAEEIKAMADNEHGSIAEALTAASRRLIMVPFHLDSAECLHHNARKQLELIRAKAATTQSTESKAA